MFRFLWIFTTLAAVGCATQQVPGTGRYLQIVARGQMAAQFDLPSHTACIQEARKVKKPDEVEVMCNFVSDEQNLPFTFLMTNTVTGEGITVRARTLEACQLFLNGAQSETQARAYKFGECK